MHWLKTRRQAVILSYYVQGGGYYSGHLPTMLPDTDLGP